MTMLEMKQPLLMDAYPRAPDGAAEIERERMTSNDVKFNRWRLMRKRWNPTPRPTPCIAGGSKSVALSGLRRAKSH
jgi:hypothetical protein